MKTFKTTDEVFEHAPGVVKDLLRGLLFEHDDSNSLSWLLGGDWHIIETIGEMPPNGVYDIQEWLPGGEFAHLWVATNNGGGPAYFIPKAIVDASNTQIDFFRDDADT